mmetsp:Transcript_34156/g.54706  ORF Transcript_34156/g.54706 Transcript_34156/m.54706 type:complete len:420 (+) Transcript_34156:102-1361(+)
MPSEAEQLLGKLRKLAANKECVNCKEVSRLGFGAVCVKFNTFVCNYCKSSHQAFSHRVKSVTMSTWTIEEVEALRKRNGGGNEVARAKWFARFTPEDEERLQPKKGDKIDKYKQLVAMVYEDQRWYDANATVSSSSAKSSSTKSSAKPSGARQSKPKSAKKLAPQSDQNLLDFGGSTSDTATSSGAVTDMFGSLTIKGDKAGATSSSGDDLDLFGDFTSSTAGTTSTSSGFDLMGGPTSSNSSSSGGADLMGLSMAPMPSGVNPPAQQNAAINVMQMFPQSQAPSDDPFLALQQPKPKPVRMTKAQQQKMRMMQQQQMQQQMQQQQFMQGMGSTTTSDDPFAALQPNRMPRQAFQAPPSNMRGPPQQPMTGMPQQPMTGMPQPMAGQPPVPMAFPMGQGRQANMPNTGTMNSDDPFFGL